MNSWRCNRPRSEGSRTRREMLFIVIHQVYELWFKQVLHEIDHVIELLDTREAHRVQHTLKRILTILKVLVAQLDILETMTPLEFQLVSDTARGRERISVRSAFDSSPVVCWALSRPSLRLIALPRSMCARSSARTTIWARRPVWDAFLRETRWCQGYDAAAGAVIARRDLEDRTVTRTADDADRFVSKRSEERRDVRAARRSR